MTVLINLKLLQQRFQIFWLIISSYKCNNDIFHETSSNIHSILAATVYLCCLWSHSTMIFTNLIIFNQNNQCKYCQSKWSMTALFTQVYSIMTGLEMSKLNYMKKVIFQTTTMFVGNFSNMHTWNRSHSVIWKEPKLLRIIQGRLS